MSKKDIYSDKAIEKLKELAESIDFAMLATHLKQLLQKFVSLFARQNHFQ